MKLKAGRRRLTILASLLSTGTLFGSCEMTLHDAFVDASKFVVADLLDPSNFDLEGLAEEIVGGF